MIALLEKYDEPNLVEKEKQLSIANNMFEANNTLNYNWISIEEKKTRDESFIKREYTVIPMELSNFIKNNLNYIFVRGKSQENAIIYVYMNGYYKSVSENEFKGFIKSFIPYQLRKSRDINEVYLDLTTEMKFVSYEELNNDENIINFEDGILYLDTMELKEHTPEILSTIQIPAKYREIENADATAYEFEKYMLKLCDDDYETYLLLLECLGVTISNIYAYRTKKALFLVGQGNTGKSQLKRLAEYLVGYDNVSNIDLKKVNDRFGSASLYQKRLSGCNDMSYQRIEDMSIFKQLTGGDSIEIEFKNKNSFNFLYKGFLWFNCNKLPLFGGDTGKWVYDRIMPVYCNNVIPKNEQDPYLFEKILKEKNSILKNILIALQRVINNGYKFDEPKSLEKVREEYEINNNTLLTFIKECCEVMPDIMPSYRTKRSDFKLAYDTWIKNNNNNRGKINSKDMNAILETKYDECYIKSNGIIYMSKLVLTPEAKEELGIYTGTYN